MKMTSLGYNDDDCQYTKLSFSIRSIYIYLCRIVCGRLENRFIVLSHVHNKVAHRIDYMEEHVA